MTQKISDNRDRHARIDVAVPYWRLWSACFLGYSAIGMTMQVMPSYVHERFGANEINSGLAVTIGSLGAMFSRPVAGRFADLGGGRRVAMFGAILGLVGGMGHAVAANLPFLIFARLIFGVGEGALFTGSVGWILARTKHPQVGKIAGYFGLSMWLGLASGPLLGTAILSLVSYRGVWLAASIIPMFAGVLVASTRPEGRLPSGGMPKRRAWFPRVAWVPAASGVFASIGYGTVAAFLVPRFVALDFAGRNCALTVFGIAFMIARFLGSGFADRFGGRSVLVTAFLGEFLGLLGLFLTHGEWLAFAATALTGAGLSLLIPSLASLVIEAADPRERTAALGAVTSSWDLGVAIGGPLGGFFAGPASAGPFAIGALAALIALVPLAMDSQREYFE